MTLCDFCNDGAADTRGQSSPQSQVLRLSDENDDEENWIAIRVFFPDGRDVLIHARKDEDVEDEIAEWCHWHGVPYDKVADFTVVQDNYERKEVHQL